LFNLGQEQQEESVFQKMLKPPAGPKWYTKAGIAAIKHWTMVDASVAVTALVLFLL